MKHSIPAKTLYILLLLLQIGCRSVSTSDQTRLNSGSSASISQPLYFPETGHTLQSPFLEFYLAHPHPDLIGYPITEAIEHEGWLVQYMQYTRLEVHPENEPAYFITVGWLGQLSHRTQPPLDRAPTTANKPLRYFPESGHSVTGDFLAFFETHGDTVQFGRPISEPFIHHGDLIQDFKSARFIWRADWPETNRVQLEPLGETYFLGSGLSLDLLSPVSVPTNARIMSGASTPLPDTVTAQLMTQSTSHQEVTRIIVRLFSEGTPLANQRVVLQWADQTRILPPTNMAGQTHTLVFLSPESPTQFILSDVGQHRIIETYEHP